MVSEKYEITEEEYQQALKDGALSIVPECIVMGYGCYGARVSENDGKYYIAYERGSSCD